MNKSGKAITTSELVAVSAKTLEGEGYRPVIGFRSDWNSSSSRLFEDEYNVVGLAVFSTCAELLRSWADLQGSLVDVISRQIGAGESKAWDGYLVLLTPGVAPSSEQDIELIRQDTSRLRKLVATGDDLKLVSDVERVLKPLLPLRRQREEIAQRSALDRLPAMLKERNIEPQIVEALISAFKDQKPLMDAIHTARRPK